MSEATIETTDFTIPATDGLEIAARKFKPKTRKAKVVYVHGFSEHRAVYDDWFPYFAKAGYEVTIFDQRGHGASIRSKHDFGKSNNVFAFSDLDDVIKHTITDYDGPLFLWGHSMGGGLTLNYMIVGTHREKITGFIANSPYIVSHPKSSPLKAKLLPVMVHLVPNYTEKLTFIKPEWLSNDPERIPTYDKDPLRTQLGSVGLMHGMTMRGARLLKPDFVKNIIDRPLLLNHGTADYLCDYTASKKFMNLVKLTDKKLVSYEGLPHELMATRKHERWSHAKEVLEWLNANNVDPEVDADADGADSNAADSNANADNADNAM